VIIELGKFCLASKHCVPGLDLARSSRRAFLPMIRMSVARPRFVKQRVSFGTACALTDSANQPLSEGCNTKMVDRARVEAAKDGGGTVNDNAGLAAQVVQGADVGGVAGVAPGFTPGATTKIAPGTAYVTPGGDAFNPGDVFHEMDVVGAQQATGVQRAFSGFGALTSAVSAISGGREMLDDSKSGLDRTIGAGNFVSGTIGTASGIAGMSSTLAPGSFLSGLATVGGGQGLAANVGAASTWGAGAGGTAAGVGTALATGGAALSAGLAGYGLGKFGDESAKRAGWFHDDRGNPQSISDWGSDLAVSADKSVNNAVGGRLGSALGSTAGYLTAGATSLAGVPLAIGGAATGIVDGVGALADWARGK
jgi:hypothetical protein